MSNTIDIINENSFSAQQKAKAQLDEIQKQQKLLEKKKEIKEKTKEEIEESKKKGEYDWTRSYRIWDLEEDEDFVNKLSQDEKYAKKSFDSVYSQYQTDHTQEREFYEKPTKEKLEMCEKARKKGNAFYKEGLYTRAAGQYRLALIYCDYTYPDKDDDEEEYKSLKVHCSLNLAQCKLKTQEYTEVINNCDQAIEIEPNNFIAYFRKAIANRSTHRFEEAQNDFELALKYVKDTDEVWKKKIEKEYNILKYMIKSAEIHEKIMAKRMVNNNDDKKRKISEDENKNKDERIKKENETNASTSSSNISSKSISNQSLNSNSNSFVYNNISKLYYTIQLIVLSFVHGCAYVIYKTFKCQRIKSYEEGNENSIKQEILKDKND